MKGFIKSVLATIVGIVVFVIIAGIFGVMSIVGMVASGQATQTVEDGSVLVLDLSGTIEEQGQDDIIGKLTGSYASTTGLNDILAAIGKAKDNPNVKGIYIEAGVLSASYATLQEIRGALEQFRKSGKWIVAYADSYSQGAYYVSSAANKVYINPQGMLEWHGIGTQPIFYKDLLAKFGVKFQVVKVGTFKSATETYTEGHMSDANRLQTQTFVGGMWNNVCQAVSKSRGISVDSLNSYADELTEFQPTNLLVKRKMVDGVMYTDKVKDVVKKMLKLEDDDIVPQISVSDMLNTKDTNTADDEIAVYYAYGSIVQSDAASALTGGGHNIVASKVCKDLEALMNASGAYYMSAPASWIVAQPNTLTGSIGIFAAIPDMSGLVTQKLGVKFDEVKTNRHTTFGNIMARPFSAEETAILQAYVNRGYKLFRKRVADGRHMATEAVEKIAQGRVWLGNDALKIKLVDQLGSLDDAVRKAAQLAKVKRYYTTDYPAPLSWTDQLLSSVGGGNYLDEQLRLTLGDMYEPFCMMRNLNNRQALQARMPYVLNIR